MIWDFEKVEKHQFLLIFCIKRLLELLITSLKYINKDIKQKLKHYIEKVCSRLYKIDSALNGIWQKTKCD